MIIMSETTCPKTYQMLKEIVGDDALERQEMEAMNEN
jgi:hypothetical protein